MKRWVIVGVLGVSLFLLASCDGRVSEGGSVLIETQRKRAEYAEEERWRNAACWENGDCEEGAVCEGATRETQGTCRILCAQDADCGNGYLCRPTGCQRDCSEIGEKCSSKRQCCFFDGDGDRVNDAQCAPDETGDVRCGQTIDN